MIQDSVIHKILKRNPDLSDWAYWEEFGVYNPTTIAGYQHYISLAYQRDMMADFRDLRFFQADGTECNYWIESKTDGTSAAFWVKPERASQNLIYAFYGNPESTSRSNGDKTFEFFDHFDGSALKSQWSVQSGTPTVSSSICTLANAELRSVNNQMSRGYALRARYGTGHFSTGNYYEYVRAIEFTNSNQIAILPDHPSPYQGKILNYDGNFSTIYAIESWSTNTYHTVDLAFDSTQSHFTIDTTTNRSINTNIPNTGLKIQCAGVAGNTSIDWILVRKYTATEPTMILISAGNSTR